MGNPIFLMCEPKHFKIPDPDETWGHFNDQSEQGWYEYKNNPEQYKQNAYRQWTVFKETLISVFNAKIILLEPLEELFDQVFTADGSLSLVDGRYHFSFLSQFTHPKRCEESNVHKNVIATQFPSCELISFETASEGSGDNIYDSFRDVYWSGFNTALDNPAQGRSDRQSHQQLQEYSGIQVNSIQVIRPFFHVDTCFASLNKGHILLYKNGIDGASYDMLLEKGFYELGLDPAKYLIEISSKAAHQYACNVINIGNKIVMAKCGNQLPNTLRKLGYEVFEVDVSYFIKAGGGPHCLTNYVNQPRQTQ